MLPIPLCVAGADVPRPHYAPSTSKQERGRDLVMRTNGDRLRVGWLVRFWLCVRIASEEQLTNALLQLM